MGETFSGIPYEKGIEAMERLKTILPGNQNLAHLALRWILMRNEVSCVIPGASSVQQVESNLAASQYSPIPEDMMRDIEQIYEEEIKPRVHQRW